LTNRQGHIRLVFCFFHGVQFKKKAPRAVKVIKELVKRNMLTKDVRIDPELNKEIWKNGVRNLPTRVEIIMERKKNEDEEEGQERIWYQGDFACCSTCEGEQSV